MESNFLNDPDKRGDGGMIAEPSSSRPVYTPRFGGRGGIANPAIPLLSSDEYESLRPCVGGIGIGGIFINIGLNDEDEAGANATPRRSSLCDRAWWRTVAGLLLVFLMGDKGGVGE